MRESKVVGIAAGLVTAGAWAALWFATPGGFGPRFNPRPHEASGWVLAHQAVSLLKPGAPVVVIARDTAAFRNPASDVQLASLKKTLLASGIQITKLQLLQVDPLRPVEVPPGDFFESIRNIPKGGVIVSLMGPPVLSETQRKQLGEIKPSIVAFCSGSSPENVDLRSLFEQGLLHAAVVSRADTRSSSSARDLQGWFDHSFLAVTSANAASLLPKTASLGDTRQP